MKTQVQSPTQKAYVRLMSGKTSTVKYLEDKPKKKKKKNTHLLFVVISNLGNHTDH